MILFLSVNLKLAPLSMNLLFLYTFMCPPFISFDKFFRALSPISVRTNKIASLLAALLDPKLNKSSLVRFGKR